MSQSPKESSKEKAVTSTAGVTAHSGIAVERAVADLRRSIPVLLLADATKDAAAALLVQAAETVSNADLERLLTLVPAPSSPKIPPQERASLILTARRGEVLILSSAMGSRAKEDKKLEANSILVLPLPTDFDAQLLAGLADPTSKEAAGPFAHLPATPAKPGSIYDASLALARIACLLPACVTVPLDVSLFDAEGNDLVKLAQQWALGAGLLTVCAEDVLASRGSSDGTLVPVVTARVPLALTEKAKIHVYRPENGNQEHLAIVIGNPAPKQPVLTRIHSSCFTGDLLESLRCDCGEQLHGALVTIVENGNGILLYLTQEGRGIGLVNKLRAYRLQDHGFDTFEANEQLGFEADERVFSAAAQMLSDLGFSRVRLLTNNPHKVAALERCAITVEERVPHIFPANDHNKTYLQTKARRGGHML